LTLFPPPPRANHARAAPARQNDLIRVLAIFRYHWCSLKAPQQIHVALEHSHIALGIEFMALPAPAPAHFMGAVFARRIRHPRLL